MMATSVQSALAIVIGDADGAARAAIDAVRQYTDASYPRWMPHVNLLYPFVPAASCAKIVTKLEKELSSIQPFSIHLRDVRFFGKPGQDYVYLASTDEDEAANLQRLYAACDRACPGVATRPRFEPHMTVAQYPLSRSGPLAAGRFDRAKSRDELMAMIKAEFPMGVGPVAVGAVAILTRDGTSPFTIHRRIALGSRMAAGDGRRAVVARLPRYASAQMTEIASVVSIVLDHCVRQLVEWARLVEQRGTCPRTPEALERAARHTTWRRIEPDFGAVWNELIREGIVTQDLPQTAPRAVAAARGRGARGAARGRGARGRSGAPVPAPAAVPAPRCRANVAVAAAAAAQHRSQPSVFDRRRPLLLPEATGTLAFVIRARAEVGVWTALGRPPTGRRGVVATDTAMLKGAARDFVRTLVALPLPMVMAAAVERGELAYDQFPDGHVALRVR